MTRWEEELKGIVGDYIAHVKERALAEPELLADILDAGASRQMCRDLIVISVAQLCGQAGRDLTLLPAQTVTMNVGLVTVLGVLDKEVEDLIDTLYQGRSDARYTCNA